MVPRPPSGPPHHFHPPDGQPLGTEEEALARAPRPDRFRPRSVLDGLLPATSLSVRSSLPLPRLGGGERFRLRRDEQADLLRASRSSARGLAGSHSGRRALAPADAHDLHLAQEMLEEAPKKGWVLGDRNYWSPRFAEHFDEGGLRLLAPYKSKKGEKKPWPGWLVQKRRRVETVISQLAERYGAKKVWARDRWHLTSRWLRKVLSHTVSFLCQRAELSSPLRFAELVTD